MEGIISINKPLGMTSHDVISILRRKTGIKKIGHAGTLDPLASGVLIVGIGRDATKKLHQLMLTEKEYEVEITLGQTSTTDDAEGEKSLIQGYDVPSREDIESVLNNFIGDIDQVPPQFSAVHINGERAYDLARKQKTFTMPVRKVFIKSIDIKEFTFPKLILKVTCGSGVYIRSLARDLGEKLGCGGFVSKLMRTRVGEFTLVRAINLDVFNLEF